MTDTEKIYKEDSQLQDIIEAEERRNVEAEKKALEFFLKQVDKS